MHREQQIRQKKTYLCHLISSWSCRECVLNSFSVFWEPNKKQWHGLVHRMDDIQNNRTVICAMALWSGEAKQLRATVGTRVNRKGLSSVHKATGQQTQLRAPAHIRRRGQMVGGMCQTGETLPEEGSNTICLFTKSRTIRHAFRWGCDWKQVLPVFIWLLADPLLGVAPVLFPRKLLKHLQSKLQELWSELLWTLSEQDDRSELSLICN